MPRVPKEIADLSEPGLVFLLDRMDAMYGRIETLSAEIRVVAGEVNGILTPGKCGTLTGRRRHMAGQEPVCRECSKAYQRWQRLVSE